MGAVLDYLILVGIALLCAFGIVGLLVGIAALMREPLCGCHCHTQDPEPPCTCGDRW